MSRINHGLQEMRELRRKPLVKTVIEKVEREEKKPEEKKPEIDTSSSPEQPRNSLLYDFKIDRSGMSDSDYAMAKKLQSIFKDPKYKAPKDKDSLLKEMGLTSSDMDLINSEMKKIDQTKTTAKASAHDYAQLEKLERLLREDTSIFDTYNKWLESVEKALGKSIGDPSSLTEEDMKNIPPAPAKLQELARFMMSGKQ